MAVADASDIDLQEGSALSVTSAMLTTGARADAPITLNTGKKVDESTVRINKDAKLTIHRNVTGTSDSALISFGPNEGTGDSTKSYYLIVNGGSLDLVDNANNSNQWPSTATSSNYKEGWPGIISMWGTSSYDHVQFTNPKFVNIARPNATAKGSYLIHLDSAGPRESWLKINSADSDYITPFIVRTLGSTEPTIWNLKYLSTVSQGGSWAYSFQKFTNNNTDYYFYGSEHMNHAENNSKRGNNEVIVYTDPSDKGYTHFSGGQYIDENGQQVAYADGKSQGSQALNSFIDGFSWWTCPGVTFGSEVLQKNQYEPAYKPVNVEQGKAATTDPSFTDQNGKGTNAPTGTTFAPGTGIPGWATVDPSTGKVTVAPGTDVNPGAYNVPVTVTYPDGSKDETTIPVIVTKGNQTVTWGDNGAVVTTVDPSKLGAHETTANSQVLNASDAVSAVSYELKDGKLSTTPTPITIDPSTVSWTTTPDTTVGTATAAGKQIATGIQVDFTNNDATKNILGDNNGAITNDFTIDAKGAGAKNVTDPVKIKLGSDLTDDQFDKLVNNRIPTDQIASKTWETKPNSEGKGGVIKITFNDKDANSKPTYLNINIPETAIKITTDADANTPTTKDISTPEEEVPDAGTAITNKPTDNVGNKLPAGTTITWTDSEKVKADVKMPGIHEESITVTYPDQSTEQVTVNVTVNAKPVIKPITTTKGGEPLATEGISNLNKGGSTPVDGYPSSVDWTKTGKPDTSKTGLTTGTAEVTYPDGTKVTVEIPVAVNGDGDVTFIDDKGHTFSLHANDVIAHKTSDKNIIGGPVVQSFKLSYYLGGQNYSKPYIYTLSKDGTKYVLTQTGANPDGVTVDAPQEINSSDIKISWTPADSTIFGEVKGNGQPTSVASNDNGGTGTIKYTNTDNHQANNYPRYVATVDASGINWPIYGHGPKATHPFPSVYIYGAEANSVIKSVRSDTTDLESALGDAKNVVNLSDLTKDHNAEVSSVEWQTLPSLDKADAKAPATVRIHFTDGSYLDVPVAVNVIKVDQGVDHKDDHDLYRDITRTINVEGQSNVQHVIYSRAKITDLSKPANQQVTYTDWVAGKNSDGQEIKNFPEFEVNKPSYTATATGATIETKDGKQYVPASGTITPDSPNETVNVTYTANEHALTITYVDQNGKTVGGNYVVSGKTDETVNVDVPGNVPENWKLVPNQKILSTYKFGSDDPQPVTYVVEHKTEVVPVDTNNKDTYREITHIIREIPAGKTEAEAKVRRNIKVTFKRTGVKDLVTGQITWNAWQGPEGSVDKDGKSTYTLPVFTEFSNHKGYDTYVNGQKVATDEIPAVDVNADSSDMTDTITYVKQGSIPVPYDPADKDMNKEVTRTIIVNEPGKPAETHTQTVKFIRDGSKDPVTDEITWNAWHVSEETGKTEGTWDAFTAPTVKGYTPSQAKVDAKTVSADSNDETVTINYHKDSDTPIKWDGTKDNMYREVIRTITVNEPGKDPVSHEDSVKFTREDDNGNAGYQDPVTDDITWNPWHVIGSDTWAEFTAPTVDGYVPSQKKVDAQKVTPDTKNTTVDITYAPTDATKYTPEGQDVTTETGKVPAAEDGIKNKEDLPDGTHYTWKEEPDVSKPGDKTGTIVVTYPDGSKDEVKVPIHVTDPTKPTDADKSDPKGQDVNTETGKVPDPSEGIKNKDELPEDTHYTWKETPDVTTPGDHEGTIVITYPDGSTDEVTVKIHVADPTNPTDGKHTSGTTPINSGNATITNGAKTNAESATKKLPQTGNHDSAKLGSLMGLSFASFAGLLGLASSGKKRKEDK